ncbi:hypothetical protein T484DRAFT_1868755 [Baffinella frigidus]|nr:hypothetical protein T484DRAFT_1868755 [Cryptophyta sp. CCMP2293]
MALPECSLSTGDTTWIILATAFCLMMGPALAFFEAGMLRAKHSLSIITQGSWSDTPSLSAPL